MAVLEPLLLLLGASAYAGTLAYSLWYWKSYPQRAKALWEALAARHGLTLTPHADGAWLAEGTIDGLPVSIRERTREERTTVDGLFTLSIGGLQTGVVLAAKGFDPHGTAATGVPGARPLGDEAFDRCFEVAGEPGLVRALLDAPTRDALREVAWAGLALRDGVLGTEPGMAWSSTALEPERFQALLAAAAALRPVPDLLARWLEVVEHDPCVPHALGCLEAMRTGPPLSDAQREAVAAIARARADAVAVAAARVLDDVDLWAPLARASDTTVRHDALDALLATGLRGEATLRAVVTDLLADPDPEIRRGAAEVLATGDGWRAIDALVAAADRTWRDRAAPTDDRHEASAERALARAVGAHATEPHLDRLVAWIPALTDDAALALLPPIRRFGTRATVAALLPLTERRSSALQQAARDAIAAIRARLGPVEAGRLAIAEATGGEVALAADTSGHVALDEDGG